MGQKRLLFFFSHGMACATTHAVAFRQFNWQGKIRGAGGTIYSLPNWEMTCGEGSPTLISALSQNVQSSTFVSATHFLKFATIYGWSLPDIVYMTGHGRP